MSKKLYSDSSLFSKEQTGSMEFQISHLTNRVLKLTDHLKWHNKDYSSQRGLWKILGKRKRLLSYLSQTNLTSYENLINKLNIRKLKIR
uniref:Small ribosomal subunit protein uS15c n=2 Tax=Amblystegiaceae TaxID=52997 RepID=A0A6M8NLC3_9BRYO|nr:ribosomal protein S15 [Amblystegium serpens]YP_009867727.1 ribosomal protein S15 [Hygroamblystegium varium var. humile]QKG04410.1 ribosomal protein S15 [Amblystegium serpens]QKG04902.1 ribosomal protein S15 [Hygroamblystegium varium var. humile]